MDRNTGTSRSSVQEWTVTAAQQTRAHTHTHICACTHHTHTHVRAHTTHTHARARMHQGPCVSRYRGGGTEPLLPLLGDHALVFCGGRLRQIAKDCPPSLGPRFQVAHGHGRGPHCTLLFQMPSGEGLSDCISKASATPLNTVGSSIHSHT